MWWRRRESEHVGSLILLNLFANTHPHDSLNPLKWAIHYTSITRESFT
jgi:hypothetical protein